MREWSYTLVFSSAHAAVGAHVRAGASQPHSYPLPKVIISPPEMRDELPDILCKKVGRREGFTEGFACLPFLSLPKC